MQKRIWYIIWIGILLDHSQKSWSHIVLNKMLFIPRHISFCPSVLSSVNLQNFRPEVMKLAHHVILTEKGILCRLIQEPCYMSEVKRKWSLILLTPFVKYWHRSFLSLFCWCSSFLRNSKIKLRFKNHIEFLFPSGLILIIKIIIWCIIWCIIIVYFVTGCLMIFAWVLFTGIGIVVARYYKRVWADKTFLKLKIWFQVKITFFLF